MALLPRNTVPPSNPSIQVSDRNVEDFLLATQPCFANFPVDMRAKVRDALQERVDRGDIGERDFAEFEKKASIERALQSGTSS